MNFQPDGAANSGTIWVQDFTREIPEVRADLETAVFTRFEPDSAAALVQAMGFEGSTEVERRISRGCRCYGILAGKEIAAYGWVSFDEEPIGEMGLCVRLREGEAYIWDCATLPQYRKRRLFTALIVYMTCELRNEGYRRIWIGADLSNLPSRRAFASAGFQYAADVVQTGDGGVRTAHFAGRAEVNKQTIEDARWVFMNDRKPADETIDSLNQKSAYNS